MEGFLARRKADPRYASVERRVDPFPSSGIRKSTHVFGTTYDSKGIHEKGSDADGDGKKGEGKGKKDFKTDKNKNGKPDFMEGGGGSGSDSDDGDGDDKKKDKKKGVKD